MTLELMGALVRVREKTDECVRLIEEARRPGLPFTRIERADLALAKLAEVLQAQAELNDQLALDRGIPSVSSQ